MSPLQEVVEDVAITKTVNNEELEWKNEEAYGAVEVAQRKAFKNFIKIWITLHKQHHLHHKFTLKVSPPSNCGDIVEACIDFAVADGVKDLELDFLDDYEEDLSHHPVEIPRRFYENKKLQQKLESLELRSCSLVPGNFAKFKALKDVTLAWIDLEMESVRTLLSTCKWMESLSLKFCRDYDESFDIEKLELKKLVLHRCIFARSNSIRFKAPNLKVFKYCSPVPPLVSQVNVEAGTIEEAHLDLSPLTHFFECGYELQKLLQHFSAVNVLTVCSVILQQYRAPYYTERFWIRFVVPFCFKRRLREVEVNGFMATSDQLTVCSHLIRSSLVLQKLSINVLNDGDPATVEMRRICTSQLLLVPKASRDLVIILR